MKLLFFIFIILVKSQVYEKLVNMLNDNKEKMSNDVKLKVFDDNNIKEFFYLKVMEKESCDVTQNMCKI